MSISYTGSQVQVFDDNGDPVSGALINFYEPGTTTRKDTYTDSSNGTVNANPVVCDANGRAEIWYDGAYKVITTDSSAVQIGDTIDNFNSDSTSSSSNGVLVTNGSFELDTITTGQPDNWTVTPTTNGVIAIDSTDQIHGLNSLKIQGTDAGGGGSVTSNKFDVLGGGDLFVRFSYKSSAVDTLNKVDIKYYDSSGAVVSTTTAYTEGAANPSSYTLIVRQVTNPATAVQAEVIITGLDSSGTTTTGTSNFDAVSVDYVPGNTKAINDYDYPSGTELSLEGVEIKQAVMNAIFYIGYIHYSAVSTDPNTLFGVGTWTRIGTGTTLIDSGAGYTAGSTYGANNAPVHNHAAGTLSASASGNTNLFQDLAPNTTAPGNDSSHTHSVTGNTANNVAVTNDNMQLSLAAYIWQRTS